MGFLKRIRSYQLIKKARLNRPTTVDDYVREEKISMQALQRNPFEMLFNPNRKLNPPRSDRSQMASACPESCKLVVQVIKGYNIPTRKHGTQTISDPDTKPVPVEI